MIRLDIDAPDETRASVAFNGDKRGVLILGDKAREDARNFRWIAELIRKGAFGAAQKPNAPRARFARSPIHSKWPPTAATRRHDDGMDFGGYRFIARASRPADQFTCRSGKVGEARGRPGPSWIGFSRPGP